MTEKRKDLVAIIKANPGCVAIIDNDCWTLYTDDSQTVELASDSTVIELGDGGYGSGNCYGGDLLQALAVIVGIKVHSV
jgi:hypothetical protein